MSCCTKSPEEAEARRESKKIDQQLKKDKKNFLKLLLLGTGDSGKSTIIKQFRIIHDSGFPEDYCLQLKPTILYSLINSVRTMHAAIAGDRRLSPEVQLAEAERAEWEGIITKLDSFPSIISSDTVIPPEVVTLLESFWAHRVTQLVWSRRHEIPLLPECTRPFFMDVARLCAPNYLPSTQDVLYTRVMTTGITDYAFKISYNVWHFYDVGGQRTERKKWPAYFDDCVAIIYVVDVSAFNTVLYEDGQTNRMVEAQNAFKTVCSNPLLKNIPVILFLNKIDLLKEKLANGFKVKDWLPEYEGDNTYSTVIKHFENKFVSLNACPSRSIYVYSTWATDTNQVKTVLATVREIFQELALKRAGLS